jgi:hypothetical protein
MPQKLGNFSKKFFPRQTFPRLSLCKKIIN